MLISADTTFVYLPYLEWKVVNRCTIGITSVTWKMVLIGLGLSKKVLAEASCSNVKGEASSFGSSGLLNRNTSLSASKQGISFESLVSGSSLTEEGLNKDILKTLSRWRQRTRCSALRTCP